MKTLKLLSIVPLLLLVCIASQAKNYYVAASGSDSNDGLTATTPWQTLSKVNSAIFAAGDVISFKRGDTFYGSVKVSANNLFYDAYGTGTLPVISGFTTLTSWTSMGGGIWKTAVPSASNKLINVTINGSQQRMGRYPNYNSTDGGWLSYESSNGSTPSITDNQLSTSPFNWTGATIAMKAYSYVINLCPITGHSGGTLTYSHAICTFGSVISPGLGGYGYFITDDLRTLDSFGEWFLNKAAKDLYVYFGSNNPSLYTVKASTEDVLFDCGQGGYMGGTNTTPYSNISVRNIAFEGANRVAVNAFNGVNITVSNVTINNCYNGIFMWNVTNSITTGNTITNILNDAIQQLGRVSYPTTITNNTIRYNGLFEGMGDSGEGGTYGAINQDGDNTTISGNTVDSVGFNGIHWQGSNVLVEKNFVNHHNMKLDDGGGIYTYDEKIKTNRVVRNNIIINGVGNRQGRTENDGRTWGLYNDGSSNNVVYLNNTISVEDGGGFLQNSGQNIVVTGNTFFGVPVSCYIARFPNTATDPGQLVRNNRLSQNISYPTVSNVFYWNGQLNDPITTTINGDMQAIGTLDSNYYRNDLSAPFDWFYHLTVNGTFVDPAPDNFSQWQGYMNSDVHSKVLSTTNKTFQYNASNSPVVFNFAGLSKKDVQGNIYNNSATIPAWGSKILFDNGIFASVNQAPVANSGVDKGMTLPQNSVTLFGSGTDADGSIVSYSWAKILGPSSGTIVSSNAATINLTNLAQGIYNFELTVADNDGATSKDSMQVTVYAAPNQVPTANSGVDKGMTLPQNSVTLYGSGTDADGSIVSYSWAKILGPSSGTIVSSNAATTNLTDLVQGIYNFELTVTDNNGATSKDSMQVTVYATLNQAPIANAGADKNITLPQNSVILYGSGTDADGTINSFSWVKVSGPSGGTIVAASAASTSITNLAKGTYKYLFSVKDNKGLSGIDTVQIIVNSTRQKSIIAKAGTKTIVVLPISTTMLSGQVIAGSNAISSYSWTKLEGPESAVTQDPNAAVTVVNNLSQDDYRYEFTVTDVEGNMAKDTLRVSVLAPAMPNDAVTFKVYPNPVQNVANMEILDSGSKANEKFTVSVINLNGSIIATKRFKINVSHEVYKLDMSAIKDGLYFIRLSFENGVTLNQQIIKTGIK